MRITTCAVALFVLVIIPVRVHAEDTLAAARELYASAAYDDALEMLDGLMPAAKAPVGIVTPSRARLVVFAFTFSLAMAVVW